MTTKVSTDTIVYSKFEYLTAKSFLKDAQVVRAFISPSASDIWYQKDGVLYFEHESFLEFPENDYYVKLVKDERL